MMAAYEKDSENSQGSSADIEVKEEAEDDYSEMTVTSGHISHSGSRNSSPLPLVTFGTPSPIQIRESSPLPSQSDNTNSVRAQIPLNDLYAGSTIRSQLQGAIAGKKMDAVQNIVEGLLRKNESLLAMSDAGGYKPNSRKQRAAYYGFIKRSEPAFPARGKSSVFPVSQNAQARLSQSTLSKKNTKSVKANIMRPECPPRKSTDKAKAKLIRPKSPTRKCDMALRDKTHFSYSLMESMVSDEEIAKIFKVQNHELVCGIGSKSLVLDKTSKVIAALDFDYFWCNFCSFTSNSKALLTEHAMEHRFQCKCCAYESFCRSDILRHMAKIHEEFSETSNNFYYCTLLSDYLRVKTQVEGKENNRPTKDPDEDTDVVAPEDMKSNELAQMKRKGDEKDPEDTFSSVVKLAKLGSSETNEGIANSKSQKCQDPKHHPQPRESDFDIFEMEVEDVGESHQSEGSACNPELDKGTQSISANRAGRHESPHKQSQSVGLVPHMQLLPTLHDSGDQNFITTHVHNEAAAEPTLPINSLQGCHKSKNSNATSLCWSCGYCSFQSTSQAEIKEHSIREHPGKPYRCKKRNAAMKGNGHLSSRKNMGRVKKQASLDAKSPLQGRCSETHLKSPERKNVTFDQVIGSAFPPRCEDVPSKCERPTSGIMVTRSEKKEDKGECDNTRYEGLLLKEDPLEREKLLDPFNSSTLNIVSKEYNTRDSLNIPMHSDDTPPPVGVLGKKLEETEHKPNYSGPVTYRQSKSEMHNNIVSDSAKSHKSASHCVSSSLISQMDEMSVVTDTTKDVLTNKEPPRSLSSLKMKFKTVGEKTVLYNVSSEANTNKCENGKKGSEDDTIEMMKSVDPKWLDELMDSSDESDSDDPSNPRSVPLSVSSASEVCDFSADLNEVNYDTTNSEERIIKVKPVHKKENKLQGNSYIEPLSGDAKSKPSFCYVPARSAAMKAMTKMKPTLADDESIEEVSPKVGLKQKKTPNKNKLLGAKAVPSILIPTKDDTKKMSQEDSKPRTSYTCNYCSDAGEGSIRRLKVHVLREHSGELPMVIRLRKNKRNAKCRFYVCPFQNCFKLIRSLEAFLVHRSTHSILCQPPKPRERTTQNSLSSGDSVSDSFCLLTSVEERVSKPASQAVTLETLPSCRVELNALDMRSIGTKSNTAKLVKEEEKKYQCLYCTEFVYDSTLGGMKSHYAKEHDGQLMVVRDMEARRAQLPSRIYVCENPECEFQCVNNTDLITHVKSHLKSNFTHEYECAGCGWYSSSHAAACQHLQAEHSNEEHVSLVHMQVSVDEFGQTSRKVLQ